MNPILIMAILTSFFCTFLVMPFWIRKAKEYGLRVKLVLAINNNAGHAWIKIYDDEKWYNYDSVRHRIFLGIMDGPNGEIWDKGATPQQPVAAFHPAAGSTLAPCGAVCRNTDERNKARTQKGFDFKQA